MQFIYFIPAGNTIESAGLKTILDDSKRICQRGLFNGPESSRGTLYSFCQPPHTPKDCNYKPDEQMWHKANSGLYWLGYYKDSPPTERELAREVQIAGHKVKLRENEEWIIPLARIFPAGTRLPQSLILGAKGEVITEILPQFVQFSSRAEKLWHDFEIQIGFAEGEQIMTEAEEIMLAAEALSLNYRINIDGINAMGLFTTQNFADVLLAIVDAPSVHKKLKEFVEQNSEKKNITTNSQEPEDSGQKTN